MLLLYKRMSSGGRKKNKGGLGLTESVSTGLLIAAEELYRNSLKKKKRGGGDGAGVTDGGTLSVQDIMNGGKRKQKKRGGEGTQFNMEEIAKEAELAAENHVGGRPRRRGRPCGSGSKKGGAAFGDFVNAISGQAGAIGSVAGVNTTPQVNPAEAKPETFASVDQDGGKKKKRSYRKKRGGQDQEAPEAPFPLTPLPGYPSATQEGGKQRRRRGGAIEGLDGRDGALLTDAFGKSLTGGKKKRGKRRGGTAYQMTVDCKENDQGNGDGSATEDAQALAGGAKKKSQKKRTYKKKKGGDAQEQINGIVGMLKNYL